MLLMTKRTQMMGPLILIIPQMRCVLEYSCVLITLFI